MQWATLTRQHWGHGGQWRCLPRSSDIQGLGHSHQICPTLESGCAPSSNGLAPPRESENFETDSSYMQMASCPGPDGTGRFLDMHTFMQLNSYPGRVLPYPNQPREVRVSLLLGEGARAGSWQGQVLILLDQGLPECLQQLVSVPVAFRVGINPQSPHRERL